MSKLKEGDVITLDVTGREFTLPWTPVESTGGHGAAREWAGVTDEMWKSLFDALADYKTTERNEVMKLYHASYQKLIKQFGPNAHMHRKDGPNKPIGNDPLARIAHNNSKIAKHKDAIALLESENAELADAGISKLKQQLKELEQMKNGELAATVSGRAVKDPDQIQMVAEPVVAKEEKPKRIAKVK